MKSILLMLGEILLLFSSCTNDLDSSLSMSSYQDKIPLKVHVVNVQTKAEESSVFLPNNSELGVFITKSDGSAYKSEFPYNNIKYTGTGNPYASTWVADEKTPVYLSADKATAYAYYPRISSGFDLTSIPVTSDGTDWMYSLPVENLDLDNSTANFTMKHAMSNIRINIERLTATDHGTVSKVGIHGECFATGGNLNLLTGFISNFTGIGRQILITNVGTIGETALTYNQLVIPTGHEKDIKFLVTIDNQTYLSLLSNVTLQPGKEYNFNLKYSNSIGLLISSISVTDWEEAPVEIGMNEPIDTWEKAKLFDGVYAIMSDGRPMAYRDFLKSDKNPTGAAFVFKGKAYQVAKVDATGYNGDATVYWDKDNSTDLALTNYSKADGTYDYGYFAATSTHLLSKNPYTWTAGALSDFNGQDNTAIILAAQNNGANDYTIGKAVMDFRSGSNNEGMRDWFVPSCGELAYMFLKMTELNTLLGKVSGGSIISNNNYCSSSECYYSSMWFVGFQTGYVGDFYKNRTYRLRLVRAI